MNQLSIILALSSLFWGWQTNTLILAIPIAVIILINQFIKQKLELTDENFKTIANICVIFLIILISYILFNDRSIYFVYTFFRWLPIVILPLFLAQLYSTRNIINLSLLFTFIEVKNTANVFNLDLRYLYLFLSIVAAGSVKNEGSIFYIGVIILVSLTLFSVKNPRFSLAIWLSFILIGSTFGYFFHIGLHQLHQIVEQLVIEQLVKFNQTGVNAFNNITSLGEIGKLKQDNNIRLRVKQNTNQIIPELLRESTFNQYKDGMWFASQVQFQTISPEVNQNYLLTNNNQNKSDLESITITEKLDSNKTLLKLPNGSLNINNLMINKLEKNQYGTVVIESNLKKLNYQIKYDEKFNFDSPPNQFDLLIPKKELFALEKVIKELNLVGKNDQEIANLINNYFQKNFNYTLELLGQKEGQTALSTFLLNTRSGHCEYFATATTLLLRKMGIPARYAVGYSVHEYSNLEQLYLVRGRHAHAWTVVFLNGSWQFLDTTPAIWTSIEDSQINKLTLITDFFSFLINQISVIFTNLQQSDSFRKYWWLWISPLILFLIWRLNLRNLKPLLKENKLARSGIIELTKMGLDSDFYLIEQSFNQLGLIRNESESLKQWLIELQKHLETDLFNQLQLIIELYYRYRFDPQGLTLEEKTNLQSLIKSYLIQLEKFKKIGDVQ